MAYNHLAHVQEKPQGATWQKCTAPGCNRKATAVVKMDHLSHLNDPTRCVCAEHARQARIKAREGRPGGGEIMEAVQPGRGRGIARKRADACGGYRGWRRWLVGPAPHAGETDGLICPVCRQVVTSHFANGDADCACGWFDELN